MRRQPEKYFRTTVIAISILVLALWSERVGASSGVQGQKEAQLYQETMLLTVDGTRIAANYYTKDHNFLYIVLNSLYADKDDAKSRDFCMQLTEYFDVLNIDFRGQGKSAGSFSRGAKEVFDLQAAVEFGNQKGYVKIGVVGFDFGGYMAIKGASFIPEIESVTVIGPPYQLESSQKNNEESEEMGAVAGFGQFLLKRLFGVRVNEKEAQEDTSLKPYLENLEQPLLVIYSPNDPKRSFKDGEEIFNLALDPKRLIELEGIMDLEGMTTEDYQIVLENTIRWLFIS